MKFLTQKKRLLCAAILVLLLLSAILVLLYWKLVFIPLDRVSRIEIRTVSITQANQFTLSEPSAFASFQSDLKQIRQLSGVDRSLNATKWQIDVTYIYEDGTEKTIHVIGNEHHEAFSDFVKQLQTQAYSQAVAAPDHTVEI